MASRQAYSLGLFGLSFATLIIGFSGIGCGGSGVTTVSVTEAQLGQHLFMDANLSNPVGESCGLCHSPDRMFTDTPANPTSEGAVTGNFGKRNTPTAMYAMFSPPFHLDAATNQYFGGQFWDGRASSLEDQAKLPLVTPVEMHNLNPAEVVEKVKGGKFADEMRHVYGKGVFADTTTAYNAIAKAIATFERTPTFAPFTSKYDAYLANKATLTPAEAKGMVLFATKANCSSCHPSVPGTDGAPPLFTTFGYSNIGVPKNPNNAFYRMPPAINPDGAGFVDMGLGVTTGRAEDNGLMKIPTLRNIAKTGPYMHNGVFASLADVVHFYNVRDGGTFGAAEVASNVETTRVGNLKLTAQEEKQIVAFLGTLTDGYQPSN